MVYFSLVTRYKAVVCVVLDLHPHSAPRARELRELRELPYLDIPPPGFARNLPNHRAKLPQ